MIAWVLFTASGGVASAKKSSIKPISSDPFSNPVEGQHHTQVEPDIFSYGGTIVAAVQQGRIYSGGSADPGWATNTGGKTWQHGSLPGLTINSSPKGPYQEASDPSVAYDAKHGTWLISTLAMQNESGVGVAVNQSSDGIHWNNSIAAVSSNDFVDKDWVTCDNTSTSPYYGNCYIEYDDVSQGDEPYMIVSKDGGNTWSAPQAPSGGACCLGGEPLVQPNGTVIVPLYGGSGIASFRSTNGGASWSSETNVASIQATGDPGSIRNPDLPTAGIDNTGKVYVAWQDCRFESGCSTNDIVMTTSTDGLSWSSPVRIPTGNIGGGVDYLLPGIGVDVTTGGSSAKLALVYYYFPNANGCGNNCQLDVGYVSSTNGGSSWSSATQLFGPMNTTWLANTSQGYMVGDYFQTTISNGSAYPAFVGAKKPSKSLYKEALYSAQLGVSGGDVGVSAHEPILGSATRHVDPHHITAN